MLAGMHEPTPRPTDDYPPAHEPTFTIHRPIWTGVQVLADGVPLKRKGAFGSKYLLPMPDGSTEVVQLRGTFTGARLVVDGVEHRLEPKLPAWAWILVVLPLALAGIGGAIGAAFGFTAFVVNSRVTLLSMRGPVKALAMVLVTLVAVGGWFGVAYLIAPLPTLTSGTCLNGIREGATVTVSNSRSVPCTSAHDNEVIAVFRYTDSSSFPGEAALQAYAVANCIPAFAAYVGIDFEQSALEMVPVGPSPETWGKGDRTISCVVLATDGSKLNASVRNSAQ